MAGPSSPQPNNPQSIGPSKERAPITPQIPSEETLIPGSRWADLHSRRRVLHTLLTHPGGHHRRNGNHKP